MFKYIFFAIIFFSSCSIFQDNNDLSKNDLVKLDSVKENPFFSMRRTPCFGQCPTYTVKFYNNGKIFYEGKRFVKNEGIYTGQINIKIVALIQDKIREINFFNLDSIYDARISDLPSVILEVNMNEKKHKVIDRYKGPDELREFEKFIDNIILKIESGVIGDNWIKVNE
tara:strand:- start:2266 stop:2772 length:507 start_codon:yes stop_codon:yes gene_type:complete